MTNNQRNTLVVGCIIFGFLALGSVVSGIIGTALSYDRNTVKTETAVDYDENTVKTEITLDYDGNMVKTETVSSEIPEKTENQQQYSDEVQRKVFEEKEEIRRKIKEYEDIHQPNWNTFTASISSNNAESVQKSAKTAKKQIKGILTDINSLEWGNTGDREFDDQCKDLKEKMLEAYTASYESIEKLTALSDNMHSAEKVKEASKAMENLAEKWQDYIEEISEVVY